MQQCGGYSTTESGYPLPLLASSPMTYALCPGYDNRPVVIKYLYALLGTVRGFRFCNRVIVVCLQ